MSANGMTLKQFARAEFFAALEAYRAALASKSGIVAASLRAHRAKAGVPKRWHSAVNRAFKEATV